MLSVDREYTAEIEVKRSKFLAFVLPASGMDALRESLKSRFPKASHIVYAFRRLNEQEQIEEGFSDDGEPSGCAGMPILKVLRGEDMIESAIVVVRHFGGIKLGTGGMVRAYTGAAGSVLEIARKIEYHKLLRRNFVSGYSEIGKIEYELEKAGIRIVERRFGTDSVELEVEGSRERLSGYGLE